jgi:lytic murein transglycosylase
MVEPALLQRRRQNIGVESPMLPAQTDDQGMGVRGNLVIFRTWWRGLMSTPVVAPGRVLAMAALPAAALWLGTMLTAPNAIAQGKDGFRQLIESLWPEAEAKGVSRATFDAAFAGVEPDLSLPDLILPGKTERDVKGQAEFTRTPAQYLDVVHLARLAEQGKALLGKHGDALEKIERTFGVPRHVVLAIWGRETAFGAHRSPHYAVQALATQAWLGRRKDMFRNELIHALKMLQDGVLTRETMKSSWAGAMGLTQFMPSEYDTLAYDLDGDGRKDIWNSVPDALASAANQLRDKGWLAGQAWGYEVSLPKGMTCQLEGPPNARSVREWAKLGVARTRSRALPAEAVDAQAFILAPGGAHGPAFLALENFMVIKRYNMSDLYALFVGNLADRIAGGGNFDTRWGAVRQLSARDIEEIQTRLQARGYPIAKIDGKAGMNTRASIGAYQLASRLEVDCWPSDALLAHLRKAPAEKTGTVPMKSSIGSQ